MFLPIEMYYEIFNFCNLETLNNLKICCKLFHKIFYDEKFSIIRYSKRISYMLFDQKKNPFKCLKWASSVNNISILHFFLINNNFQLSSKDLDKCIYIASKKLNYNVIYLLCNKKKRQEYPCHLPGRPVAGCYPENLEGGKEPYPSH